MKLRIAILVFGLVIVSMGDVYGADWKFYSSSEKVLAYYDAQSITRPSKNIIRLWLRVDWNEKGVLYMVGGLGKEYENLDHSISLSEINCAEKKSRRLSTTNYDRKGSAINSFNSPTQWTFIVPESIEDSLYEEICK